MRPLTAYFLLDAFLLAGYCALFMVLDNAPTVVRAILAVGFVGIYVNGFLTGFKAGMS